MGNYSYTMTCPCCTEVLLAVTNADGQAWKDDVTDGGHRATCSTCGCEYVTEDDGTPATSGGGVQTKDESAPRIDSLGATEAGSTDGGTTVRVNGHKLSFDTLTVKFDGVAGTGLSVIDEASADVDTPAGKVELVLANICQKLAHGSVTGGPFQVGETVTGGTSGATAVVRQVEAAYLMVDSVTDIFEDAETITGGTSGATADLSDDPVCPQFEVDETVTGQTSAETAVVKEASPLRVDTISGDFAADEEILGGTSGARATLDDPAMNGDVDVTVENATYGQRPSGGVLVDGFEYTS